MAASTLDPDNIPESDRQLGKGHGNTALGPSDLSDTGSDVQGGYRAIEEFDIGLDRGTNEDSDSRTIAAGDDTTDSSGTGEDSTAGRNNDVLLGEDIGFDRIDTIEPGQDPLGGDGVDADTDPDDDALDTGEIGGMAEDAAALDSDVPLFDRSTRS